MRSMISVLLFVAAGCGGAPQGDSTSARSTAGSDEAGSTSGAQTEDEGPIAEVPFPWTAIRDATAAGRTYVFRFREDGRVRYERWVFGEVSESGWVSTSTPVDEDGEPTGEPERSEGSWQELERHAHFPADATEIGNATLTLPLRRFLCRLYTVTATDDAGRAVVSRFWFANDLPGAPVRMLREVDGETVVEMQLMAHEPPL